MSYTHEEIYIAPNKKEYRVLSFFSDDGTRIFALGKVKIKHILLRRDYIKKYFDENKEDYYEKCKFFTVNLSRFYFELIMKHSQEANNFINDLKLMLERVTESVREEIADSYEIKEEKDCRSELAKNIWNKFFGDNNKTLH